jgi:hypothetical protein
MSRSYTPLHPSAFVACSETALYECEAQSAIIPFVGIVIRKGYEQRQQSHFIFISRRVATKKES